MMAVGGLGGHTEGTDNPGGRGDGRGGRDAFDNDLTYNTPGQNIGFDWGNFRRSFSAGSPLGPMAAIGMGIYGGTRNTTNNAPGMTVGGELVGGAVPSGQVGGGQVGGSNLPSGTVPGAPGGAPMSAQDLNTQRYDIATGLMSPYIDSSEAALNQRMIEMGLTPGESGAYMQTPAYQALLDERLGAVQQGAANTGSLYSGRRMQSAADIGGATQTQFYDNYMKILGEMSSPAPATNLASLGLNQGIQSTSQQIGVAQKGSEASAAKKADERLAMANIVSGYMGEWI